MTDPITLHRMTFAIDCPDAVALAEFYAGLLGWRIERGEDDRWVEVHPPAGQPRSHFLAFQAVANYLEPVWPDGPVPQQAHLDFYVPDLATASVAAVAAGARRHAVQPSESGSFIVFLDPAGHPFCLCADSD